MKVPRCGRFLALLGVICIFLLTNETPALCQSLSKGLANSAHRDLSLINWKPRCQNDYDSGRWTRHWDGSDWLDEGSFLVRYNRVEGLFLGVRLPSIWWWERRRHNFALTGHVGYGIDSKAVRYRLGLQRWAFDDFRLSLGAEVHDLTDTQDEWVIPTNENSLAAFLLHEDFQDFYRKEGWSAFASQRITRPFTIKVGYHYDEYYDMNKENDWALFGGRKEFRENPLIDTGLIRSWSGRLTLDTRDYEEAPEQGWLLNVVGELAGRGLESDYEYDRVIVDIRRYQPLGWDENIDVRLRVGSSVGDLPRQFLFDLGGLSTLRGYDFKEFTGDRMVLANIEYRLEPGRGVLSDLWLFQHSSLIFFVDSGLVWFGGDNSSLADSFDELSWSKLRTDVGLAIADHDGRVRINIAKRTDVGDKPVVVTFRINRAF